MKRQTGERPSRVASSVPYFEAHASAWSAAYSLPGGHGLRARRDRLLEVLGERRGVLLDVGCGPAVLAPDLAARGWRYVGVDAATAMLANGREALAAARGSAAAADARLLPFEDRSFDAVVCLGVLDRVAEQERAVAEMLRVTRPGGEIVVSFPNRRSPYASWTSHLFRPAVGLGKALVSRIRRRPPGPHLTSSAILHSPASASDLVARAGGRVAGIVHFDVRLLLPPVDEVLPGVAARLSERLEWLRETRLSWLATGFLVHARRPTGG